MIAKFGSFYFVYVATTFFFYLVCECVFVWISSDLECAFIPEKKGWPKKCCVNCIGRRTWDTTLPSHQTSCNTCSKWLTCSQHFGVLSVFVKLWWIMCLLCAVRFQVPVGGCYRLIDIPMSNCINSGINKIFVLTQFNSASLNRHIARTYFGNGINFGDGFVEVCMHHHHVNKKKYS